jgi:hypothetical protein
MIEALLAFLDYMDGRGLVVTEDEDFLTRWINEYAQDYDDPLAKLLRAEKDGDA